MLNEQKQASYMNETMKGWTLNWLSMINTQSAKQNISEYRGCNAFQTKQLGIKISGIMAETVLYHQQCNPELLCSSYALSFDPRIANPQVGAGIHWFFWVLPTPKFPQTRCAPLHPQMQCDITMSGTSSYHVSNVVWQYSGFLRKTL